MEPRSDKEETLDDAVTFPQSVQGDDSERSSANPSAPAEVDQLSRKDFETEIEKATYMDKKTDNTEIESILSIPRQAPFPSDNVVESGDVPASEDLMVSKDTSDILHKGGDLPDNGPSKPITESDKKDIPFLTEPSSGFPAEVIQVGTYTTTTSDQETDDRTTMRTRYPISLSQASEDTGTDVQDTQTSDTSPGYNRATESQDSVSLACHSADKIASCSPKQRKNAGKILKLQEQQGLGMQPDFSLGGNHFYMDNSTLHLAGGHGDTQKQTNDVFENIEDETKQMIVQKDPAKHVSTYAERSALRLLKTFSAVFIKGRSGSGKTSVGLKLLEELTRADKRTPVCLAFAHQWSLLPKKQVCKYVVMIDDIFGSSNLVQSQVEEWSRLFDFMWPSVESGQILLVITSRPEISAQCENKVKKYKLMKTIHSVTLDQGEFALRAAEKEKLLKKICGKRLDLTPEQINNIVHADTSVSLGFPQCCEFFASNPYVQKHGPKFFHESVEYVGEIISRLKETDQIGYAVLLLVMLSQGSLVYDRLKSKKSLCDFQYLMSELSKALGLTKCLSRIQIETKAESFRDIYLEKQRKNYYFKHQSLPDALFNAMAKEHPETLIKICPVQMLLHRVKIHDGTEGRRGFLSLTPDCYDQLAKRITEILLCKQDRRVLEHPSLQDKRFLQHVTVRWKEFTLEAKIRPERIVLASLMIPDPDGHHSRKGYSLFHCDNLLANIVLNCRILGGRLLKKVFRRSKNSDDSSQVLACAIYTGQSDIVQMLLDKGVSADERCFRALCGSRDLDEAVTDRVLKQMDWNVFLDRKMLYLASTGGNSLLTKKLLDQLNTEREATVLECLKVMYSDTQLREDLLSLKLQTTVSMLLDCIQNPDIDTKSPGYCSLIVMCAWHADSLKELFSRQWNFTTDQWWYSLNKALKQGSTECVEELIAHRLTEPCRIDDFTEYICNAVASRQDMTEKIKLILNYFSTMTLRHSEYGDSEASTWIKAQLNSSDCNIPIHSAVNHQNVEVMKLLTDAGADINLMDNRGRSPLHIAAKQNAIQTIQFLIQHGANVNIQDENGETPLYHAVQNHFMDCVNLLIEAGADVNLKNCHMLPVFLLAEKLGIIKRLLSSGSDINTTDKEGRTALHKAIQRCDMDTVKFLLTKGSNVDCADSDGYTPLHLAAVFADVDILKYVCEKGATTTVTTYKEGRAVVHCAALSRVDAMEKMQYLFHTQDIAGDEVDDLGRTALFYLIDSWDQEVAEFMIENGCDLHHQNKISKTLLFQAVMKKNKPAFDFLVKNGLDVKHVGIKGDTLLHTACFGKPDANYFEWVSSLLDAGVDPDKCTSDNRTALHMAVHSYSSNKTLQVCQLLIERMTNVDQQDTGGRGQTALHFAVRYGLKKIVLLLLQKGANRSIKDDNGKTAEGYAHSKAMKKLFESQY